MDADWKKLYDTSVNGRPVELWKYMETGSFRVTTTQHETEILESYATEDGFVFGGVVEKGQQIDIEAESQEDLVRELLQCGFSPQDAKEIARHAL